jgi:hypothetical protein
MPNARQDNYAKCSECAAYGALAANSGVGPPRLVPNEVEILAARSRGKNLVLNAIPVENRRSVGYLDFQRIGADRVRCG